jgi:hypothetical protein
MGITNYRDLNKNTLIVGFFDNEKDAARAYNDKAYETQDHQEKF